MKRLLPFLRHGGLAVGGNLASLGFNLARVKLMAAFLGPAGMGLVSLYANFLELAATLFGAGFAGTLNRELPRARDARQERAVWATALWCTVVPAAVIGPVLAFAFFRLSPSLEASPLAIAILVGTLACAALWRLVSGYYMGKQLSGRYFWSLFNGAFLPLAAAAALVAAGIDNPLAFAVLAPVLVLAVTMNAQTRQLLFGTHWRELPPRAEVIRLARMAGPIMLALLIVPATWFYIRSVAETRIGAEALGQIQPGFQLVILAAGLFANFAGMTVVRWDQSAEAAFSRKQKLLLAAACAIPLMAIPLLFLTGPLLELMIALLFTREFLPAVATLPWFLGGEALRMGGFLLNQTLISKGFNSWTLWPRWICLGVIIAAIEGGMDSDIVAIAQAYALGHLAFFVAIVALWIAVQFRPSRARAAGGARAEAADQSS